MPAEVLTVIVNAPVEAFSNTPNQEFGTTYVTLPLSAPVAFSSGCEYCAAVNVVLPVVVLSPVTVDMAA